jgi:predicted transcriptional regulator
MDILELIKNGSVLPTRIMHDVNTSWKTLQQMLRSLINQELIREYESEKNDERTEKVYGLTEKGKSVLIYFRRSQELAGLKKSVEIMSGR